MIPFELPLISIITWPVIACVSGADVDPSALLSPEYCAVITCTPTGSDVARNDTMPALTRIGPPTACPLSTIRTRAGRRCRSRPCHRRRERHRRSKLRFHRGRGQAGGGAERAAPRCPRPPPPPPQQTFPPPKHKNPQNPKIYGRVAPGPTPPPPHPYTIPAAITINPPNTTKFRPCDPGPTAIPGSQAGQQRAGLWL